jgi:hypothetical protein
MLRAGQDTGRRDGPEGQCLAEDIFGFLARQFPVCMASDEFHYFPQAAAASRDRYRWDDFSPARITATVARLERWQRAMGAPPAHKALSPEAIDQAMLRRVVGTLREQLTAIRPHQTQPTFYLTIIGIGLAEALSTGPEAWALRIEGLPAFLDQAIGNLQHIPQLFRDLGLDMLGKQRDWLRSLPVAAPHRAPLEAALGRFQRHLETVVVQDEFRLPIDLYERIAQAHMGCDRSMQAIAEALDREIAETRGILERSAAELGPGRPWQAVVADLPPPPLPPGGVRGLFAATIADLARHCCDHGLIEADLLKHCPVAVEEVPAYMRPVRSNAAFSMPPGHPPRGGTFFIQATGAGASVPADYRLLTAHETLPGHHLLDTCRWRHPRAVRRHIEFPIFYEGWASFSEELLFETGFFAGPLERMLMAKRRFWRAVRGRIDVLIHLRRCRLDDAAAELVAEGLAPERARAMVRRYSLKPGYQLAYTIGRRRFLRLWERFRQHRPDPASFAARVLEQGEIGFDHLEQILTQGG